MGVAEVIVLIVLPALLWLTSWAYCVYDYIIRPKKSFWEGLKDMYRDTEDDWWW